MSIPSKELGPPIAIVPGLSPLGFDWSYSLAVNVERYRALSIVFRLVAGAVSPSRLIWQPWVTQVRGAPLTADVWAPLPLWNGAVVTRQIWGGVPPAGAPWADTFTAAELDSEIYRWVGPAVSVGGSVRWCSHEIDVNGYAQAVIAWADYNGNLDPVLFASACGAV